MKKEHIREKIISGTDNMSVLTRDLNTLKRSTENRQKKLDVVFLELSCCIGESIVFLNSDNPDAEYLLNDMINLQFSHTLALNDGYFSSEDFNRSISMEGYVLILGGAVPLKQGGAFCILGYENGKMITSKDILLKAVKNAGLVINAGTCSCFGGIAAASPNVTGSVSIPDFFKMYDIEVPYINVPGCPIKNEWILGTIEHLIEFGMPELDEKKRPIMYFGDYIHDHCQRRGYFDSGIFATKMGDKECYYKLGCLGPITRANCSLSGWNGTENWPVGNNSPCIGCAYEGFPDRIESFIKEEKDLHGYKKRD